LDELGLVRDVDSGELMVVLMDGAPGGVDEMKQIECVAGGRKKRVEREGRD
jgi:hypothetical protein